LPYGSESRWAGRLVGVDVSDYALATAKNLGATHTVNPKHGDAEATIHNILPEGPDVVVEAAGPIQAVELMVSLLRRGTRWNLFGITTHEKFQLDGGWIHFLEARMDASFSTNPRHGERDPSHGAKPGQSGESHLSPFPTLTDRQGDRDNGF
jgi:threonine dehydrogenase-like Zn-dependent dehydrogenase